VTVVGLCRRVGMSVQNYYAQRKQRRRRQTDEELVLALVRRERQLQPRLGTRKLRKMLEEELRKVGIRVGRDRVFEILRRAGLLVERKPRRARTTNSRHALPVFRNLVRQIKPSGPHEVWVSDLTYIRTAEGFMFAALITDWGSRKIVGLHLGDTLESVGCQAALKEALRQLPAGRKPIHHSDRGCQYCCHEYVKLLRERELPVSMTEELHCYENAVAERVNGILKQEYELDRDFGSKAEARQAVEQAVYLYNHRRPHLALQYQVPEQVHQMAA
jgi:putative transposase